MEERRSSAYIHICTIAFIHSPDSRPQNTAYWFILSPSSLILFEDRMWPTSLLKNLYYSYIFKTFILPVVNGVEGGSLSYSCHTIIS